MGKRRETIKSDNTLPRNRVYSRVHRAASNESADMHRALWYMRPEIAADVREWLLELETREWLMASFVEHGDADIARAFDWLEVAAQQR